MSELKIGVIGIPGKWSTDILADAVAAKTGFRLVIDMSQVVLDLSAGRLLYQGRDLCELDALVVKKISQHYSPNTLDRLEMLRVAERNGVRVFSSAEKIIRLIDRLSCTVTLRNAGIPMPPTRVTEDVEQAIKVVRSFGEVVLKPLYSTKARGMCVLDNDLDDKALRAELKAFRQKNPMIYMQQKINLQGRDLGLVFLGGEYVCAYARVSQNKSWNTTIHAGGKYQEFKPDKTMIELARRSQEPFCLDFTTVDIAETESGPVVFEVSAFGGFRGAKEGCGIDAAALYTQYVMEQLNG